jgi:dTDP-4-amino-4,6-dideoxygalactose transaminase
VLEKHPDKIINKTDNFPNTDFVSNYHICLPLYPGLKNEEIDYVVSSLKKCILELQQS